MELDWFHYVNSGNVYNAILTADIDFVSLAPPPPPPLLSAGIRLPVARLYGPFWWQRTYGQKSLYWLHCHQRSGIVCQQCRHHQSSDSEWSRGSWAMVPVVWWLPPIPAPESVRSARHLSVVTSHDLSAYSSRGVHWTPSIGRWLMALPRQAVWRAICCRVVWTAITVCHLSPLRLVRLVCW